MRKTTKRCERGDEVAKSTRYFSWNNEIDPAKIGVDSGWVGDRKTQDKQRSDRWLLGRDTKRRIWAVGDGSLASESFCWIQKWFVNQTRSNLTLLLGTDLHSRHTHTPEREVGRQLNVFADHAAVFTSDKACNTASKKSYKYSCTVTFTLLNRFWSLVLERTDPFFWRIPGSDYKFEEVRISLRIEELFAKFDRIRYSFWPSVSSPADSDGDCATRFRSEVWIQELFIIHLLNSNLGHQCRWLQFAQRRKRQLTKMDSQRTESKLRSAMMCAELNSSFHATTPAWSFCCRWRRFLRRSFFHSTQCWTNLTHSTWESVKLTGSRARDERRCWILCYRVFLFYSVA